MAKKRQIGIQFPLAGLNKKGAVRQQPPYTSPDLLNVRAVTGLDGRERGGSRPGLEKSHLDDIGGPVRLLNSMTLALGDGFTAWSDTFSGSSLAAAWTQASWATDVPSILPTALASIDFTTAEGEVVADLLTIDTTKAYAVEMFLSPWEGAWHGSYRLYLRLHNTTPDIETAGVMVEVTQTGTTGAFTGILRSVTGGVATDTTFTPGTIAVQPGWLTATVSSNTVTVYWNGTQVATATVASAGSRVGFGLECTVDGGLSLANVFRVQYFSTGSIPSLRSMLIASASGDLYYESTYGRMTAVSSNLTLNSDVLLTAAQDGQDLYISDYGDLAATGDDGTVAGTALDAASIADWTAVGILPYDMVAVISNPTGTAVAGTYKISTVAAGSVTLLSSAGTGNCSYRIERAPKIYDPLANTLTIWTATVEQVPTGCPLVCRYQDRMVLAGADIAPHVWYMSRKGDPLDWDYVPAALDSERAVAGTSSEAGVPGEPITALIPHSDDYLVIGCRNSLWRLQGDPAFGGSLGNLSQKIGVLGAKSWCLGPDGALVFLSFDGLYALPPGGASYPVPLSRELLPREFLNINPDIVTASLEYDVQGRGIHIFLTSVSSNARIHWWMDWERKTFWPLSLSANHEPTATCAVQATAIEDSGVVLGGRDGILRRFSDLAENDCGTSFSSYAVIGPIALAKDSQVGIIQSINADIAEGSGDVTWAVSPSLTFEGAVGATATDTGTWAEGLNATIRPAARGQACTIKLTGEASRRWAVEQIDAIIREAGERRIY